MEANPKPKDASKALCEALLAHSERGSGSVLPAEAVNLAANAAQPLNLPIKHQPNLLLPLLSALRARGCTALASQYVMRFGLAGQVGLHELVGEMVAQGDFGGVFHLCANRKVDGPPHSLQEHYPGSTLLLQALSAPRYEFRAGAATSQPWEVRRHLPLIQRWICGADDFRPLLCAAVGALLAPQSPSSQPPALAEAVELQLATVSPAAARAALPPEQHAAAVLARLVEADMGTSAALRLLRKFTTTAPLMADRGWTFTDLGE